MGLLARREHSRAQLERKLAPHADSPEALSALLDDLVARRLLSDERFVEARTRLLGRKFGVARIRHDLQQSGADAQVVAQALLEVKVDEFERAFAVWQQRFGEPAVDASGRARQTRFLMARGFDYGVVRRVLQRAGTAPLDEEMES